MRRRILRLQPLLTLPQIVILLAVLAALIIGLDLNRRAQAGRRVGVGEEALQAEIAVESTRQVELKATLVYVQSDDYVVTTAREEQGMILPGERAVAPLLIEATATPAAPPAVTPDPASYARAWQAWWRLLTDAPFPSK
ncbi:MAG: hypothetical protein AB1791_02890 [Chloroflexota bacterium]